MVHQPKESTTVNSNNFCVLLDKIPINQEDKYDRNEKNNECVVKLPRISAFNEEKCKREFNVKDFSIKVANVDSRRSCTNVLSAYDPSYNCCRNCRQMKARVRVKKITPKDSELKCVNRTTLFDNVKYCLSMKVCLYLVIFAIILAILFFKEA